MELSFNFSLVLLTIVKLIGSDDVELSFKKWPRSIFYWVLGPRRTTSVVLQEVPIISPLLGLEPSSNIPPGPMHFFFFFKESSPMHLSAYIGRYHRSGLIMSLVKASLLSIIGRTHYSPYLNTKVKDF